MKIKTIGSIFVIICVMFTLSCACRSKTKSKVSGSGAAASGTTVTAYGYRVKNVYPHDPAAFTQGLYWHDGYLWESTGLEGQSQMRKVRLETGEVVMSTDLAGQYFGEGAAYLDGKIYQLTWENGMAFVYDPATLARTGQFRYPGQGWGLTTDDKMLYMSDGSSRITLVDPADFSRKRSITVRMGRTTKREINELEWIDGKIWANIYLTDQIVIIDPATGNIEGTIDLSGLLSPEDRTADTDVLNGIAHDHATGRIFVTGKKWPKLFEIEIFVND